MDTLVRTNGDSMAITTTSVPNPASEALTDAALDRLRDQADPLADNAVGAYFWRLDESQPEDLLASLVRHTHLPAKTQDPAIRTFFEQASVLPSWADEEQVRRGQDFFARTATDHIAAAYLAALPSTYASAAAAQVLDITARLRTDPQRRIDEMVQFLMDVSEPGALVCEGAATGRILHVRLMHAAVRWLIGNDGAIEHVAEQEPAAEHAAGGSSITWSASWGRPVNQEDLIATFLSFTTVAYDVFDRTGADYSDDDVADHLHMWRLIAHWLGVDPAIVPLDRASAAARQRQIWSRQHAPSAAGAALTGALLDQATDRLPRVLARATPTVMRQLNGDLLCDMVAVPDANWTRWLLAVRTGATKAATFGRRPHAGMRWVVKKTSRRMVRGLEETARHGDRPAFQVPAHLKGQLGR